jgi:hypothetical protein
MDPEGTGRMDRGCGLGHIAAIELLLDFSVIAGDGLVGHTSLGRECVNLSGEATSQATLHLAEYVGIQFL